MTVHELLEVIDLNDITIFKLNNTHTTLSLLTSLYYDKKVIKAHITASITELNEDDIEIEYDIDEMTNVVNLHLPRNSHYLSITLDIIV